MRLRNAVPYLLLLVATICSGGQAGWGQSAPDLIVYNGKIITVSDKGFTSNVGTIAQAMAVKDDKITAVGTTAQMRALAGASTKQVDLEGRTVVPGLIVVHDHPYDWAPQNPYAIKKVLTDDVLITRYMNGSPAEQQKAFPGVMQEAVSKAKPGEWIFIVFSLGEKYEYGLDDSESITNGKMIPLTLIDQLTPINPVLLRDPFTGVMVNSKAIEVIGKQFPHEDMLRYLNKETGLGGGGSPMSAMRWVFHEVLMKDHYPQLREVHRIELSYWASVGVTTFASRAYTPSNLKVYTDMAKKGDMPVRSTWTWGWRETFFDADPYLFNTIVLMEGLGNDWFWNSGGWGVESPGSGCTTLQPRVERPAGANRCQYEPSSRNFARMVDFVKAGGRISALHMGGDLDVDYLLEAIEKGSKEAGFTADQVRAKRHTFDHLTLSPRPDQIDRIKRLGMDVGGAPFFYMENVGNNFKNYGEIAAEMTVPKKALVDAQIPNGFEIDRPLATTSLTVFWTLARFIDRKVPQEGGKVYAPNQRINRELALKTATVWGAHYMMKEDKLGALEPGKLADFLILDRDYLTIPEDDIENIRVLWSVVGGSTKHLVPSLAKKWGMQPTGVPVEMGGPPSQW